MKVLRHLRLSTIATALFLLAGCATQQAMNRQSIDRYQTAQKQLDAAMSSKPSPTTPETPIDSNIPYVNVIPVSHSDELPEIFNQPASFNSPSGPAWSFLQRLQTLTGIAVRADDDVLDGSSGGNAPAAISRDATLSAPTMLTGTGGHGARAAAQLAAIAYQGTTSGLLDLIAGHLDATWKYDQETHSIHIFRFESEVLHIDTVPGDASSDSSVESGQTQQVQGGQGQTVSVGQSPSKTAFTGKLNVWQSVVDNIKPMLSAQGVLQISEPTASITVHDRWDRVDAVEKYVAQVNRSLDTQIEVNVKIYRVQQTDTDNRGISWNLLYNTLGQAATSLGVTLTTPQPTATGLSSLVLNAPTTNSNGGTALFSGSEFFLNALSSLGKVSVVTNATIETVNNMPAPFKVVHSVAYVASTTSLYTTGTSSSSSSVVGAGATLQPGEVETGFNMQVLPSVTPDGHRLLLQTMLSVSNLDSMATFTSGGNSVQQPNVSARQFLNRAWLKSGQTLVLAGFQDTDSGNTTNSILDKSLWGLGGNRAISNTADEIVVVITPVVTQPQSTIE